MSALKRRLAPSTPLSIELVDENGEKFVRNFRVCFNMNAAAAFQEKTGLDLTGFGFWAGIGPKQIRALLWAAVLQNHPEYDTVDGKGQSSEEGLEVIGSYMDEASMEPIFDALWKAYLAWLSPEKREWVLRQRAESETKRSAAAKGEDVPLEFPSTGTPATELQMAAKEPHLILPAPGPSPATISESPMASSAS